MALEQQVVHRIEDGMDRRKVACTTYQQRNFYTQMRDGCFTRNEVMNYALHHQVVRMAAGMPGAHLLDVCCGRGLLLPMLRYQAKGLGSYTGLDIEPKNAIWRQRRVTTGEPIQPDYYPWPTAFVEGDVAEANTLCRHGVYDLIVYMASIEHMHPERGRASLRALRNLAHPDTVMVLTCPNTPEDQDGYDTRYRAHVYEWKLSELHEALADADWHVTDGWGADMGTRDMGAAMEQAGYGRMWARLRQCVPAEWLIPALAPLFVQEASEVVLVCKPQETQQTLQLS